VDGAALLLKPLREPAASYWLNIVRGAESTRPQKRVKAAKLEGQITILLYDYRQAPKPDGGYDRIVSVEMLEHVGDKFMIQYFESISSLLNRENSIMNFQGMTIINSVSTSQASVF